MSVTLIERHLAFICPLCYDVYENSFNIFEFSSYIELSCPSGCRDYLVKISHKKDKFQITLNCPACGDTHSFSISSQSFINKDFISFSCPEWNIKIFFSGQKERVQTELENAYTQLLDLEEELDSFLDRTELVYVVFELLQDLINDNKGICSCGNSNIILKTENDMISLYCTSCKKHALIKPTQELLYNLHEQGQFTF